MRHAAEAHENARPFMNKVCLIHFASRVQFILAGAIVHVKREDLRTILRAILHTDIVILRSVRETRLQTKESRLRYVWKMNAEKLRTRRS